ncbi:MAG: very short patch repair endonuclease [Dehalococcoidia bacterium]|nr:very short patch repair endonuclease [Dehalococcoidia bacterium]
MVNSRQRDTGPELALRSRLFAAGLRYRVHFRVMPRRLVDVAFPRARVAVFVDGCFWHKCPIHTTSPKANAAYWAEKLAKNAIRDSESNQTLREMGWRVIRVWEHEDVDSAALRVRAEYERALESRLARQ